MTETSEPETTSDTQPVFARIAMSMSGGGFRAAAYSLGTLNGLYKLGLLDRVHMLSTISGGTFTGMFYALHRKQGLDFPAIYDRLYALLDEDRVLPNALKNWQRAVNSNTRDYKLIRAFADEYHQNLFGSETFDLFWRPDPDPSNPFPLQSLIFGATELYTGVAFRFQYANLPDKQYTDRFGEKRDCFMIGNGNVHILQERARAIRLADIVASSSCFPVGFEPLEFPGDYPGQPPLSPLFMGRNNTALGLPSVAIVDGGVYDNQGIEGLILANERNAKYEASDEGQKHVEAGTALPKTSTIFLISDVDSAGTNLFPGSGTAPKRKQDSALGQFGRTFETTKWVLIMILLLGVLVPWYVGSGSFLAGLLVGVSAIGIGCILVGQWLWRTVADQLREVSEGIYTLAMPPLLSLTIRQLIYLVTVRVKTAVTLLVSVFLRRVRSLNYSMLYADDEGTKTPRAAVLPSIVGSIVRDYERPAFKDRLRPVYETVLTASQMGTTLWWLDQKFRFKPLLESAEITLVWRIMRFFEQRTEKNNKALADNKPLPHPIHPDDERVWKAAIALFESYCQSLTEPRAGR